MWTFKIRRRSGCPVRLYGLAPEILNWKVDTTPNWKYFCCCLVCITLIFFKILIQDELAHEGVPGMQFWPETQDSLYPSPSTSASLAKSVFYSVRSLIQKVRSALGRTRGIHLNISGACSPDTSPCRVCAGTDGNQRGTHLLSSVRMHKRFVYFLCFAVQKIRLCFLIVFTSQPELNILFAELRLQETSKNILTS